MRWGLLFGTGEYYNILMTFIIGTLSKNRMIAVPKEKSPSFNFIP